MAWPELQLLGRWTHTGTLAAGAHWSPTPTQVNEPNLPQGQLNGTQVGEVARMVVYSPVNLITGVADDLQYVQVNLDGVAYPYIWASGRQDSNMCPPPNRVRKGAAISFGSPIFGPNGEVAGLLAATCPKFVNTVSVTTWAGASAVTHDFTVELWGYIYDSVKLAGLMPVYDTPDITIPNPRSGKGFTVVGRTIRGASDWRGSWTSLPGGMAQGAGDAMPVNKLVRVSLNAVATTKNQAFNPNFLNSNVANPQDNLYFKLSARQAILIERYGVNGPAYPNSTGYDLLSAWVAVPSEAPDQAPAGGIPADYNLSETRFGLAKGETNKFEGVPLLPQGPQLVANETAYMTYVDNSTSIPANDVRQAFVGTLIGTNAEGV